MKGMGAIVLLTAGVLVFAVAGIARAVEKTAIVESVKSDLEVGLGLTVDQKAKIKTIRDEFKVRQQAIKSALSTKNEALRQALDADDLKREKVDAVVTDIKILQGDLVQNRVDVVFKLREIYTPKQIKLIKARLEKNLKEMNSKKTAKKPLKVEGKKTIKKK